MQEPRRGWLVRGSHVVGPGGQWARERIDWVWQRSGAKLCLGTAGQGVPKRYAEFSLRMFPTGGQLNVAGPPFRYL